LPSLINTSFFSKKKKKKKKKTTIEKLARKRAFKVILLWGYHGAVIMPNILFAEIMAIWHSLKLCWESGYRKVLCCSD
jgi:hypothetical protein